MRQCSHALTFCWKANTLNSFAHARVRYQIITQTCPPSNACILPQRGFTSSSAISSTTSSFRVRLNQSFLQLNDRSSRILRQAHSASNAKWLARQSSDRFTREAKVANLKSRAAFKLLQINERYKIFRPGMTVVDLGYAPGSWSQVAIDLVRPGLGRVVGVDMIPIQPPKGVSGMQGNFLSPEVQARVRDFLRDETRGKMNRPALGDEIDILKDNLADLSLNRGSALQQLEEATREDARDYKDESLDHCVDVVLSDMSAPWEITSGHFKNSISNPYRRMMNTTGNKFRDHAGSMDLCRAALQFSYETLKVGGSFVCKFYQGAEDRVLERQLKALFGKVHREKPESSRSESRESFFVCLKRLAKADRDKVFDDS